MATRYRIVYPVMIYKIENLIKMHAIVKLDILKLKEHALNATTPVLVATPLDLKAVLVVTIKIFDS